MAKKEKNIKFYTACIRNYLRKLWLQSPIRVKALKREAIYYYKTKKDGEKYNKPTLKGYKCAFCGEFVNKGEECVHHVRNLPQFDLSNLLPYIKALLFPDLEDLEIGHKTCHKLWHKENGSEFKEKA